MIAESLHPLAVPIDTVKPDSRNARQHPEPNLAALKKSLKAYGQRKPIVVNSKTGIIEAGNGLWVAAKSLGWDSIAAVMVEDDPESATGFAIMDNRSAEIAEWNLPTLKDLLEELDSANFDMDLTGFDTKVIEDLMTAFNPIPEDQVARLDEKKKVVCPECGKEFTP